MNVFMPKKHRTYVATSVAIFLLVGYSLVSFGFGILVGRNYFSIQQFPKLKQDTTIILSNSAGSEMTMFSANLHKWYTFSDKKVGTEISEKKVLSNFSE